jgi:hypothetical protein
MRPLANENSHEWRKTNGRIAAPRRGSLDPTSLPAAAADQAVLDAVRAGRLAKRVVRRKIRWRKSMRTIGRWFAGCFRTSGFAPAIWRTFARLWMNGLTGK